MFEYAHAAPGANSGGRASADATAKFRYGESEDALRNSFVSSRAWALTASADIGPKARLSPFVFGSVEASLEKAIAGRQSGGAGAKWVFAKTNTGSASASLAVLGERTKPLNDTLPTKRLARWSLRLKVDQRVGDRFSLAHVTFYAPVVNALSQYTITSTSVGAYSINPAVAFTLTFTDNYDSQAGLRGAPSNNDGALLFGVRGTF